MVIGNRCSRTEVGSGLIEAKKSYAAESSISTTTNLQIKLQARTSQNILHNSLLQCTSWNKVRAAEALLSLNLEKELVEKTFLDQEIKLSSTSAYHVGILRVLYQCGNHPSDRLREIRNIAFTGNAVGKIHAVETLAKLAWAPSPDECNKLRIFINGHNQLLADYSAWLLACGKEPEEGIKYLLHRLKSDQPATAAYAFSYLDSLPDEAQKPLFHLWESLDKKPVTRVFALMSLLKHKRIVLNQYTKPIWYKDILSNAKSRRMIALLLADNPFESRTDLLNRFLSDPDPDVRINAAYSALKLNP